MRRRALSIVAGLLLLAVSGCRPGDERRATSAPAEATRGASSAVVVAVRVDGAAEADAAAHGDARAAPGLATPDAGATAMLTSPEGGAPLWPLPSNERLLLPFRGTGAHGFVAVTSAERDAPRASRRTASALGKGETLDLARPVLVASFTKLWTAVAALRMVERGELSLDDSIQTTLPALASRPWASSTLRELLSHTSLVPELDERGGYYRRADIDFASPVETLAANIPRDWTEKRGVYKYRNAELAVVGAILAARSKTPAAVVLAKEVFEPSGMIHAGLLVGKSVPPGLDLTPMGPIRPQTFFTAGAGYASAADLLAFFEALAGTELLRAASKALLFEGASERGGGALACWAYPFARPEPAGETTLLVERPGSFGNVRLFSAFFPELGRAVVAWTGDGVEIARPRSKKGIGPSLARAALE